VPAPDPASDERMLVTLGEGPCGAEVFSGGRKNGSSFHELSATGAAGGGAELRGVLLKNCVKLPPSEDAGGGPTGAAGGIGAGALGGLLKSCVKPPSADTESDTPCEEKPFERDGPDDGGTGRGVSSDGRAGGV
jgi:hypothetical protein